MDIAGSKSRNSRVTHVVQVDSVEGIPSSGTSARWSDDNRRPAACGELVHPSRSITLQSANEVCLKCRRALDWPMVVTWESHGRTFTTDFRRTR